MSEPGGRQIDWKRLCDAAPSLVGVCDERGVVLYVNQIEAPHTREQVLGTPVFKFLPPSEHEPFRALLARATRTWCTQALTVPVDAGLKGLMTLRVTLNPLGRDEHGATFAVGVVDLTARQSRLERLEGALHLVMEHATDVVTRHDACGLLTFASQSLRPTLGVEPSTLVGQPFAALLHADDRSRLEQAEAELAAMRDTATLPLRFRKPNGGFIWLETSLHAVRESGAGRVLEYVGLSRDVTRPSVHEERAYLLDAEMAHVARLSTIGEMAAGLAHEVNQPLTAISTYAFGALALMKQDPGTPPRVQGYVEEVARLADRAAQIVKRVRSFAARREPVREREDLATIVRAALAMMDAELRLAGVRIAVRLPAEPVAVDVDRVQLTQVLVNLIKNAGEALALSDREDRNLVVEVAVDDALGVATTAVLDNGEGLSPRVEARVFEPFVTTKPEGLGLGLSISRTIVEAHGGAVTLEHAEAAGTAARFTLPMARAPS